MSGHEKASLFDRLRNGLAQSGAYSGGELTLVTTDLPVPPPKPGPKEIVSLRKDYHMSQAVFAAVVNVSVKTVQSWEQGVREPSDAALRMLQLMRREPDIVQKIFAWRPTGGALSRGRGRKQEQEVG
jgi:putative transcriptional regulator